MDKEEILRVVANYNKEKIRIGVLGSHSALEIGYGAKQEEFETVVVCQRGREKTYAKYYKNLFDYVLVLDKFAEVVEPQHLERLQELSTIFVPNRSFSVYVGYENIEEKFAVPIIGNRYLLKVEERDKPRNQYYLLQEAGIPTPKTFKSFKEIDRPVIIKVPEKERKIERAFFKVSSPEEFERKTRECIEKGIISQEDLEKAVIEEYVVGTKLNANFFWSPLSEELDLLGFDQRLEIPSQKIQAGHKGVTVRERLLEKIFDTGERFVKVCKKEYPPGIIGLCTLQGVITKDLEFKVFDVSVRSPGCPCVEPTSPYMKYKYGIEVGPGRRVAMEIKRAMKEDKIKILLT